MFRKLLFVICALPLTTAVFAEESDLPSAPQFESRVRPHGSLGNLPPAIYVKLNAPGMRRSA